MRNLKRVLSLTLASVMLLGLMVVGTSAVGYSDVDYNKDNVEAIEVTSVLGIFEGDAGTSNFRPADPVTRAEMAKIMATLLGLNYQNYEGTHPFTDTVGHWAEAYIAACTANGVINGRGGGIYDPAATVSGIEASAMLMRALGYFKYASDVADGFEIATMSQANKIGIFSGITGSAYAGMPRGDVAQLVLNALQCSMVEATNAGGTITFPDGTTYNTGSATYTVRTVIDNSRTNKYGAIGKGVAYGDEGWEFSIELGEELYDGKLERTLKMPDAFGRTGTQWRYNNKEVGTYKDEPDLTYTKAVKGKDIWNDLGRPDVTGGTYYVIDGDTRATVKDDIGIASNHQNAVSASGSLDVYYSNKDVVTEVYYDANYNGTGKGRVTLIMYGYYLAQANDDYNEDDDSLSITVLATGYDKGKGSFEAELDGADFGIAGYKRDDYMIVTAAFDGTSTFEIQSVSPATTVSNVTVTEYRHGTSITAGGKTYNYGYQVQWDTTVLGTEYMENVTGTVDGSAITIRDTEYNLYLSPNGYVVGMEAASKETSLSDYVFVEKADNLGIYGQAKLIFMDGTSTVATVSKIAAKSGSLTEYKKVGTELASGAAGTADIAGGILQAGWFYTYSVDKSGNYQLTSAGTSQGWLDGNLYKIAPDADNLLYPIIKSGNAEVGPSLKANGSENVPVNSKTVFVAKDKAYVGVENTPKVPTKAGNNIYYLIGKDTATNTNYVMAVYTATGGSATSSSSDWFYIYDGGPYKTGKDADGTQYYMMNAVQGTKVLKDDNALLASDHTWKQDDRNAIPGLYKIESYTDGYADIETDAGSSYYLAKDCTNTNYPNTSNLVYAYRVLNDTYIKYADGILNIVTYGENNGLGEYYYVKSDAAVYLVNANTSGQSVSSSRSIGASGIKNLPQSSAGYDVYLIMDEEGSTKVELAYFVRLGS